MRQLIAVIALMALALPAGAATCTTGTVNWDGTSPHIDKDDPTASPHPSIVGQYFWVTQPEPVTISFNGKVVAVADSSGETVSVGVPSDAEQWKVCYGTADAPPAAAQPTPAIGGAEVEREPTAGQQIIDALLALRPF